MLGTAQCCQQFYYKNESHYHVFLSMNELYFSLYQFGNKKERSKARKAVYSQVVFADLLYEKGF